MEIDFEKVDEAAHYIPSGMNVWDGRQERFDLTKLNCFRYLRDSRGLSVHLAHLAAEIIS